jgi:hypothetical protein
MSATGPQPPTHGALRRWFHRALWEHITELLIFAGLFMLMQPFSLTLFSYSFIVILVGTFGFTFATKLPE